MINCTVMQTPLPHAVRVNGGEASTLAAHFPWRHAGLGGRGRAAGCKCSHSLLQKNYFLLLLFVFKVVSKLVVGLI